MKLELSNNTNNLPSKLSWIDMSIAESLAVLMQKERTVYRSCDYLHNGALGLQGVLDEEDRTKMVEWCYSVVDICQLERESVSMAMEMVDRFLSKKSNVAIDVLLGDRIQFQLLTLTALYVSIKMSMKVVLGSEFFSIISRDLYAVKEIEAMEKILLEELSWYITAPTCVQMSHHILSLISTHTTLSKTTLTTILNEVEYQAEYSVRDYYFVTQRPSTVAIAAILNTTLDRFDKHESEDIARAVFTVMSNAAEFESMDIILATRKKLHSLVYGHGNPAGDCEETDDQWYLY